MLSVQHAVLAILSLTVNLLLFQGLVSANVEMYADNINSLEKRLSVIQGRDVKGRDSASVLKDMIKDLSDLSLSSADFFNTLEMSLAKIDEA